MSSLALFLVRSAGRACSIVGKFVLLIMVVRSQGPETFAVFAIVQGWAVFASKLLGLGAIYWLGRRAARETPRRRDYLMIHAIFCVGNYLVLAVILAFTSPYSAFVSRSTLFLVLVAEHAATESNLLAYYAQRQRAADLAMLIRNLWPVVAIVALWLAPHLGMTLLYWIWIASGLLATLVALSSVDYWDSVIGANWRKAWGLAKAMAKMSLGPLIATLAYTAAISLDRQLVQWSTDLGQTALYSFYASCAGAVAAVLQFGFTLPANAKLTGAASKRVAEGKIDLQVASLRRSLRWGSWALLIAAPPLYFGALRAGWLNGLHLGDNTLSLGAGFLGLALVRIWFEFETAMDYVYRRNDRIRKLNLLLAVSAAMIVPLGGWIAGASGALGSMAACFVLVLFLRASVIRPATVRRPA